MRSNKKQIQEDIHQTKTLRSLMLAYEEIAALRMKKIREQVVLSRDFHQILSHYFHEIRSAHNISTEEKTMMTNDRQMAILISDDKGLYGDILTKTKDAFVAFAKDHPGFELCLIGTLYAENIKQILSPRDIHLFSLSGSTLTPESLQSLLILFTKFPNVMVFHGKFVNFVNQQPQQTSLTGDEPTAQAAEVPRRYVLEPSHASLLTFFQQEIVSLLFEQTLLEGTLSKEASRMISLQQASEQARTKLHALNNLSHRLDAQTQNKQQLTYLAGLSLWKVH